MKIKKVLTTSMLCALVCTALPVSKSFADETDKTEVKIERTSIEEVNKSLISSSDKIFEVPSALELAKLEQDNNIYSLVSEEDTKMPELEENSYYVKESTEMKPVLSENEEETIKVEKGSVVKVEMSGDKKAIVSVNDKVGTIDVELLTKETVEPEKNETEIKAAEEKKAEENKAETLKKAPVKKVSLYATENLNVRSDRSSSSSKLGVLSKGEKVNGIDKGEWVEFNFNGKTGYVMKSYLSEKKPEVQQPREEKSKKQNNSSSSNNSSRQESQSSNADVDTVVNLALAQVGKPYVWGSANPNVGFDCSGLVHYVYKQVGITLSRSSYSQINYGTRVKSSELRKGDLVFFNNGGGRISHVGIYIGNNKFVHASTPGTGVIVSKLFGSYFGNTFVGATRLIK
ncbi:C40 family peptidase [Parvimonas sp. C2]|uniref:C40 family peptidase n=1 Tax=Parvimonas sp. C2 TaxID=3110692 RepID=UPI002B48F750|nr:SH3 domain-containing C40 family peptidase [Parvimonas sp. C2]MEB3073603.1 SH3 domain-containing C40 family peptidase [Parvimonas sp. C2]